MNKERAELVERGSPLRELNFQKSHSTVCKSSPPCQSFFFHNRCFFENAVASTTIPVLKTNRLLDSFSSPKTAL